MEFLDSVFDIYLIFLTFLETYTNIFSVKSPFAVNIFCHLTIFFLFFSGQTETGGPESAISADEPNSKSGSNWQCPQEAESFKNGFSECVAETVHFLVEKEHIPPENPLCARLVNHLKRHLEQKPGLASAAAAGSPGAGSGASGATGNGSNATNMGEVSKCTLINPY